MAVATSFFYSSCWQGQGEYSFLLKRLTAMLKLLMVKLTAHTRLYMISISTVSRREKHLERSFTSILDKLTKWGGRFWYI